ncbi:MAG: LamG-like jellyroll fold domain-containing protein [Planctomycetota bacterium]
MDPIRTFSIEELRAFSAAQAKFGPTDAELDIRPAPIETTELGAPIDVSSTNRSVSAKFSVAPLDTSFHSHPSFWLGIGFATLLGVLLGIGFWGWQAATIQAPAEQQIVQTADDRITPVTVARIIKKVDCQLEEDQWTSPVAGTISATQEINLRRGLLVLEFGKGARVMLRGPARAVALSDNSMTLEFGTLSAKVPSTAYGFRVMTPASEVIDLGTEFGVFVGSDGATETHVFDGEVLAKNTSNLTANGGSRISLTAGNALRVKADGSSESISSAPSMFPRVDYDLDHPSPPPPVDESLRLWFDPNSRVQVDVDGRVMAWGDSRSESNDELQDSWQINKGLRPKWAPNAFNGHNAIEFSGNTSLIVEPLGLRASLTAAVVFQLDADNVSKQFARITERPDLGLQLLNMKIAPNGVIQIGEDGKLKGRMHLGYAPGHLYDNDVGVVESTSVVDSLPHVLVYTYAAEGSLARLYIDGVVVDETNDAPPLADTCSARIIGSHPYRPEHGFVGLISEVLVFDKALSKASSYELSAWLLEKYDLIAESNE